MRQYFKKRAATHFLEAILNILLNILPLKLLKYVSVKFVPYIPLQIGNVVYSLPASDNVGINTTCNNKCVKKSFKTICLPLFPSIT